MRNSRKVGKPIEASEPARPRRMVDVRLGPVTISSTFMDERSFSSERFDVGGNPIDAMNALVTAVNAGRYPPVEVLLWLRDVFVSWHNDKRAGMDRAMGLSRPRGKTPTLEEYEISWRNAILFEDMNQLVALGASQDEAAELARDRYNADKELRELLPGVRAPEVETIVDLYGKRPKTNQTNGARSDQPCDPQVAKEILSRYPATYTREKLMSRFSR